MTGEIMPGRPREVYIRNMLDVSVLIARTSAAQLARHPGSIKAHIRQSTPFYDHLDHGKRYKESDPEGWKPKGDRGVWWYETLRAIGSIKGLPLVVMRAGLMYGEGFGKYESEWPSSNRLPVAVALAFVADEPSSLLSGGPYSSWIGIQAFESRDEPPLVTGFTKEFFEHA